MVTAVKKTITVPLVVGGGIRNGAQSLELKKAGADIIVTGTIVENCDPVCLAEIIKAIKS
jgi:phosphoglycerol geranylgeranyltransferase